jgi:cyanophycinase
MKTAISFIVALLLSMPTTGHAQEPAKQEGKLLLIGGRHQDLSDELRKRFFELAGGKHARIIIVPTGVADVALEDLEPLLGPWRKLEPERLEILHTRDPKIANDPEFVKSLTKATAVFFTNGHRHRMLDAYRGTLVERELKKLHERGGLLGGCGTGAAILGELTTNRGANEQKAEAALKIQKRFLLDCEGEKGCFEEAVLANPDFIALQILENAAIEIQSGELRSVGKAPATLCLPQGKGKAPLRTTLKSGNTRKLAEIVDQESAPTK